MKSNRIMWGLVALIVLVTIVISFGTMTSHSQKDILKEQDNKEYEDLSKYAIADYDAPESGNAIERQERKLKNKRYDNQDWVVKNPHPDDSGVGLFDEIPPPPAIPTAESDLVIVGKITNASAYLSNDKKGIYSEYNVRVDEIFKGDSSNKVVLGDFITADRAGGYVRYPNGQKVIYLISQQDLPRVGSQYVLFLTSDKENPNYKILTGYDLKGGNVTPLDTGRSFDELKGTSKLNFTKAIRNKILEALQPVKN